MNNFLRRNRQTFAAICFAIFIQTLAVTPAHALTSGPSQEEFASFEPVNTSNMVNPYTGDFTYNIPLLSVPGPNGGYPINLAYHSGITMDQEASWVGLGWNVNVGAINRQLRGIPDDFDGDEVVQKSHMRSNWGLGLNFDLPNNEKREFLGFPNQDPLAPTLQSSITVKFNNYKGLGIGLGIRNSWGGNFARFGLGISYDSDSGSFGFNPSITGIFNKMGIGSLGINGNINSVNGLQSFGISGTTNTSGLLNSRIAEEMIDGLKSNLSFSVPQNFPMATVPVETNVWTYDLSVGGDYLLGVYTAQLPRYWTGFSSKSKMRDNGVVKSKAYGYSNTPEIRDNETLLDYNRTSIPYSKHSDYLFPSTYSHDLFSMTGQGTGGHFRAHRDRLDILAPRTMEEKSKSRRINGEVSESFLTSFVKNQWKAGVGNIGKSGYASTFSGRWPDQGMSPDFKELIGYGTESLRKDREKTHYRIFGERSIRQNGDIYDLLGGETPATLDADFNSVGEKAFVAKGFLEKGATSPKIDLTGNEKKEAYTERERTPRTTHIKTLNHEEASDYGMSRNLAYMTKSGQELQKFSGGNIAKDHHVSEIDVLQADGMRYVYGLPAYNLEQEDATFSVNGKNPQADMDAMTIASIPESGVGTGNYYHKATQTVSWDKEYMNKTKKPAYVHSWLLTNVVSSDYIDRTGNGVSDDDYGYWMDFKYQKWDDYGWRSPYSGASYLPGKSGDRYDDMGSYSKGKKELYYLDRIVTKSHVAVFSMDGTIRKDGYGADYLLKDGGKDNQSKMMRLDEIKLYVRAEYDVDPINAIPVKTVHFEYDNSLCKGIENADGTNVGKLTLKKVYTTYNGTKKGKLNSYRFEYGNNNANEDYAMNSYDKWGNLKRKRDGNNSPYYNVEYDFHEHPYTEQEQDITPSGAMDNIAENWHLTKIKLPTGGELDIEYERDDYAYVQDKRAMMMFDIVGLRNEDGVFPDVLGQSFANLPHRFGPDSGSTASLLGENFNHMIYFPLKTKVVPISGSQQIQDEEFRRDYLEGIDRVYFRTKINLVSNLSGCQAEDGEYVSGFAKIKKIGGAYGYAKAQAGDADYTLGYVTLEPESVGKLTPIDVHPFRKAAFSYMRTYRQELLFGDPCPNPFTMNDVFGVVDDALQLMMGYEKHAMQNGMAESIKLNGNSIIRLLEPEGKKLGDGNRIRSVRMNDKWTDISTREKIGETDFYDGVYGQIYEYTIMEDGKMISSGVAHESLGVGKDEHPLYNMETYEENWTPTGRRRPFVEKPLMSNYFPAPSVGYSKVMVRSITSEHEDRDRATTPISIYGYHTPKDFPVEVLHTKKKQRNGPYEINGFLPAPFNYSNTEKDFFASQGYTIILNDMAGKPKYMGQAVLLGDDPTDAIGGSPRPLSSIPMGNDSSGDLLSIVPIKGTRYFYQTDGDGKLDNRIDVLTSDRKILEDVEMGVEHDILLEMIEDKQVSKSRAVDMNFEGMIHCTWLFIPGDFFLPLPIPYSSGWNINKTSIRQSVLQKVVHKSGILHKVEVHDEASSITTENLYYDALTGEPLLTKTKNEFHDDIFSYSQKAHWFERGMSTAYENRGLVYTDALQCSDGDCGGDELAEYFEIGDQVWIEMVGASDGFRGHVYGVRENNANGIGGGIGLMDWEGVRITGTTESITVLESGKKNLLTANAGGVTAMVMEDGTNGIHDFKFSEVLNASAVKYRDVWHESDQGCTPVSPSTTCNTDSDCGHLRLRTSLTHYSIDANDISTPISNGDYYNEFLVGGDNYMMDLDITEIEGLESETIESISYNHVLLHCNDLCSELGGDCCGELDSPCNLGNLSFECLGLLSPWEGNVGSSISIWDVTMDGMNNDGTGMISIPLFTQPASSPDCSNCYYRYAIGKLQVVLSNGCVFEGNVRDRELDAGNGTMDVLIGTCGAKTTCDDCTGPMDCAEIEITVSPGHEYSQAIFMNGHGNNGQITVIDDGNPPDEGSTIDVYRPQITITVEQSSERCTIDNIYIDSPEIDYQDINDCSYPNIIDLDPVGPEGVYISDPLCSELSESVSYILGGTLVIETRDGCSYSMVLDLSESSSYILRPETCRNPPPQVIAYENVFARGGKGLWRPWVSYTYLDERNYNSGNLKDQGHYDSYVSFDWSAGAVNDPKWKRTNMVTKYSNKGYELENKNALDQYSSALYEYNGMLVTAVASNARYQEIAFESFEEYPNPESECRHLNFEDPVGITRDARSHTGEKSLMVGKGGSKAASVELVYFDEMGCSEELQNSTVGEYLMEGTTSNFQNLPNYLKNNRKSYTSVASNLIEYPTIPRKCGETGLFAPYQRGLSTKYILSAWVSGAQSQFIGSVPIQRDDYPFAGVKVTFTDLDGNGTSSALPVMRPSGPVIEGWQRIYAEFELPNTNGVGVWDRMRISLECDSEADGYQGALFDDIRIHPFDGNMKGFVYDIGSMKVTAELDANNYATYYIYDSEGNLSKMKKETEEGIKTLQEGSMHVKPSF